MPQKEEKTGIMLMLIWIKRNMIKVKYTVNCRLKASGLYNIVRVFRLAYKRRGLYPNRNKINGPQCVLEGLWLVFYIGLSYSSLSSGQFRARNVLEPAGLRRAFHKLLESFPKGCLRFPKKLLKSCSKKVKSCFL